MFEDDDDDGNGGAMCADELGYIEEAIRTRDPKRLCKKNAVVPEPWTISSDTIDSPSAVRVTIDE